MHSERKFFPYILLNVQRRLMKVFNAGNYWEVICVCRCGTGKG